MATTLLLYTPRDARDVLGRLILLGSRGSWCHVALARDGVLVHAVSTGVKRLEGPAAARAIAAAEGRRRVEARYPGQEEEAWAWLEGQAGRRYSFLTIASDTLAALLGIRLVVRLGGTYVCSSLAARYLQFVGALPLDVEVDHVTPADLGERFLGRRAPRPQTGTSPGGRGEG